MLGAVGKSLISQAIPEIYDLGKSVLDRLFPDPAQNAKAKLELLKFAHAADAGQIRVNVAEAQHRSIFVAGWRPAIGWACGAIMLWTMMLRDIALMVCAIHGIDASMLPNPNTGQLWGVLTAMLGMSAYRTSEKKHGIAV